MGENAEFGVRLPVAGPLASKGSIRSVARAAEDLGFDAVWVHDFIIWTEHLDSVHISCGSAEAVAAAKDAGSYSPNFYESLTTLAYVAGITERVRLGVAVLCLPFRNPILAAKQIATLDQLSEGRLILGVGVGATRSTGNQDFEVLGIPRTDKYRRTDEYVRVMKAIWTQPNPAFSGEFVSFDATEINPKPWQQPHPPIWLGGAGPKAIDMAGRFGDGWIPGRVSVADYPDRAREIQQVAAEAHRPMERFTVASEIYACIAKTEAEAVEASRDTIEILTTAGGFRQLEDQVSFSEHALIGSPVEIARKVDGYVSAGVTHFEIKFIYRDFPHLLEQLSLFSREVTPQFRS